MSEYMCKTASQCLQTEDGTKKAKRITCVNFSFEYSLCVFKIRSGTIEIVTQVSPIIPFFLASHKQAKVQKVGKTRLVGSTYTSYILVASF